MVCYRISGVINVKKGTSTSVLNTLNTRLTNAKNAGIKLADDGYTKTTLTDGAFEHVFSVRYTATTARDTLKTQIVGIAANFDLTKYSFLEVHTCYHNETPSKSCDGTQVYQEWGVR